MTSNGFHLKRADELDDFFGSIIEKYAEKVGLNLDNSKDQEELSEILNEFSKLMFYWG